MEKFSKQVRETFETFFQEERNVFTTRKYTYIFEYIRLESSFSYLQFHQKFFAEIYFPLFYYSQPFTQEEGREKEEEEEKK